METSQFHMQSELDKLYVQKPRQLAFQASSKEEFAIWKRTLRMKIAEILGMAGRTAPKSVEAELLQSIDRGDYLEEKYALDVGENTKAPMYVLVPKSEPPYKPIMAFHGHGPGVRTILGTDEQGKSLPENPHFDGKFARAMAKAGYLVVALEQRGFGERVTHQMESPIGGNSCRHLSFEYMMQGRTMVGERCWDGMVAISYVQGRDDVLLDRLGCVGFSGGGTTTVWLSALDDRITAVVPASYLCSFKYSILGVSHCECNYVPNILEYAELGDLAALIAPRPIRVVSGENDPIFPIAGVHEAYETVKIAYDLLGIPEKCSLTTHSGAHDYDNSYALDWFNQWL